MSLFQAITTKDMLTQNGMPTNSTTSNFVLDLFFKMGGSRSLPENAIEAMFSKAFYEDKELATKALFYNRDIREGQGERRSFRIMFSWLCKNASDVALANLENVPHYGRWDDILVALDTPLAHETADFILSSLKSGDGLCAKWMPRDNKKGGHYAELLRNIWGLSARQYRKLLSGNTQVVETLMCNRQWSKINYNSVPSKAINNYRDAYLRNDETRFRQWLADLVKPESGAKINAGAIFPHDIVGKYLGGGRYSNFPRTSEEDKTLEAQWKALPNYVPEGRKILPVVDVSGSMGMGTGLPIKVAVALGIYISERNYGVFKDGFVTFSENPQLQILNGSLLSRISQLTRSHWDMNTNLERVFDLILVSAITNKLTQDELPEDILILSDMQFDSAISRRNDSATEMITRKFQDAGYKRPNIIFWNLNSLGGVPVKYMENGTALVSGFSPSLMKSLLSGELNPVKQMLSILNSERYERVKV